MTVENISWSISTKECCRPRRGLNPRPPGLQSDGASNWATEADPKLWKNIVFNTLKNIWFGYLLESPHWGDSNKYPKHIFYEEIRTKQDLSYISICSLSILYNSQFVLTVTSSGTDVVVVTRVHCTCVVSKSQGGYVTCIFWKGAHFLTLKLLDSRKGNCTFSGYI